MGIVLKVTPEVLTKMAEELQKQIDDIKLQFDVIDTEINRTRSFWEGDASDTHKNQYDALKDGIEESVRRLKNHPVNLLEMAGVYKETEAEAAAVTQSLLTDVIV